MQSEEEFIRMKKEILNLHTKLAHESSTTESLREELKNLKEEYDQLQFTYLNGLDYATTLENTLEEKLEQITHKKAKIEMEDFDQYSNLRVKLALEVEKNESLNAMNQNLLNQLEQFRTLYINTLAHSTAIENELDEKYREVSRLSITDPLTGILNRSGFNRSLEIEKDKITRKEIPISLIMFDIDHFKEINDNYGHDVGDLVLIKVVQETSKVIRKGDIFCRWGGDEFLIILPEAPLSMAEKLAKRIRDIVMETKYKYVDIITCSFGITLIKPDDDNDLLLKRVDMALYDSKRRGRNTISVNIADSTYNE